MSKYLIFLLLIGFFITPSFSQGEMIKDKTDVKKAIEEYYNRVKGKSDAQNYNESKKLKNNLRKETNISGIQDRKHFFMNGNNIATEIYNYGGIAPGFDLIRNVNNGVWRGLSYIFQFCPIVAASVPNPYDQSQRIRIVSDGLWDYPGLREVNPTGDTLWTFQPLPGYAEPDQEFMASNPAADNDMDGKPDSWPRTWYNSTLGRYVWPGYLEQDVANADLEVFWAMDDRDNSEFPYWPFPSDSGRRGIGIQIDGRALQWSSALAENTIFFVYTITNVSEKDLDSVYFGIYGDPDVGGGNPEPADDRGFFIPPYNYDGNHDVSNIPVYARSMVYFWDNDGKGDLGLNTGYIGCKFLESPGNSEDGIDNDGDGMIDERQDDGIDNDNDWNPLTDDVGIDGIANTGDEGEGDGVPTSGIRLIDGSLDPLFPGEPNFELTDLDESDQIGLTSFNSWTWNTDKVSNDESMWNRIQKGNFGEIQQNSDIVFIFGSGPISLKKGETKRISMALLFGENLDDLLISAETVQRIYNANYRFFKPPAKPHLTAVPDDKKVTLYWDNIAEESIDPITGKDFEGYVIYRSTDPNFGDIQNITDGKGSKFLSEPLRDINGNEAKWDVAFRDEPFTDANGNGEYDQGEDFIDINLDGLYSKQIPDWWKGYHLIDYASRGIKYYLGNNSGLVHSFKDSNNVINGQTYYYSVVAYDHGDSTGIPPTETTKKITVDPITSQFQFDVNTVQVIPGPRASGYTFPSDPSFLIDKLNGIGTGNITLKILNDLEVVDKAEYRINFSDTLKENNLTKLKTNYSVLRLTESSETFTLFGVNYTTLSQKNISEKMDINVVNNLSGRVYADGQDYIIDYVRGLMRKTESSTIQDGEALRITYNYYPLFQSQLLNNEDGNIVFDGLLLQIDDAPQLSINEEKTRWIKGNTNFKFTIQEATIGSGDKYPADYEIEFSADNIDSALILAGGNLVKIPVSYTVREVTSNIPQPILTFLNEKPSSRDGVWNPGEEIVLFKPNSTGNPNETTWGIIVSENTEISSSPIPPSTDDILFISTNRPFNQLDEYYFKTSGSSFSSEKVQSSLNNIFVVPNPYIGSNSIEPTTRLPGQSRGERRVYFENLPPLCTIRIYTLSGELVTTLHHESSVESGKTFWNLLNEDGFSVSYGIYLAHIDIPNIGDTLIKFALIK